jgi:hypothetical protein
VNIVDGKEVELEGFIRQFDRWSAVRYTRENGVWVRQLKDAEGLPIPEGCIKCHGSGPNFGPTPKGLMNFTRPKGWFEVLSPFSTSDIVSPGFTRLMPYVEPGDTPPNRKWYPRLTTD